MKNSIKFTALVLLASTGIFASASAKSFDVPATGKDIITLSSLPSDRGIAVKVEKNAPGKVIVMISDKEGNIIFKDALSSQKGLQKGYVLNKLENGDYIMEVTSNKQTIKKNIHVYTEYLAQTFIVL